MVVNKLKIKHGDQVCVDGQRLIKRKYDCGDNSKALVGSVNQKSKTLEVTLGRSQIVLQTNHDNTTTVRVLSCESVQFDLVLRFVCYLGRCSREGCKDIQSLYSATFSSIQDGEIWGPNPHPDVCGLATNNEPKHNVWLKLDLLQHKKLAYVCIYIYIYTHIYVCIYIYIYIYMCARGINRNVQFDISRIV